MDDELPVLYTLQFHSGDDVILEILYREGYSAVDITGFTVELRIHMADATNLTLTDSDGLTLDGPTGSITITLESADTLLLVGVGYFILQITAPYQKTLLYGDVVATLDGVSWS